MKHTTPPPLAERPPPLPHITPDHQCCLLIQIEVRYYYYVNTAAVAAQSQWLFVKNNESILTEGLWDGKVKQGKQRKP